MERTKTLLVILLVVAAFALLFLSVRQSTVADLTAPGLIAAGEAKAAPDFALPVVAGSKPFHLQEVAKAQPVVLDFWATWCGPCREELPHIEALSRKYRGRVAFYGVNSSDAPPRISLFANLNGLTFPLLADTGHTAAFLYGADAIPLLVVVDTQGKVRSVVQGYDPSTNVEKSLSKILDTMLLEEKNTL